MIKPNKVETENTVVKRVVIISHTDSGRHVCHTRGSTDEVTSRLIKCLTINVFEQRSNAKKFVVKMCSLLRKLQLMSIAEVVVVAGMVW